MSLLMHIAEHDEFDIVSSCDDYENEMIQRLLSKNLNRATDYSTSNAKLIFKKLRKPFTKNLIF